MRWLTILALLALTSPAAATSLLGRWGTDGEACAFSPTRISGLAIDSRELSCRFRDVSRTGDTVTWRGSCDRVFGSRVPDATVTAKWRRDWDHERVVIEINGTAAPEFVRCH